MPAFPRKFEKKRFTLNIPNKLSFLKIKTVRPGEPENQNEVNLRIKKVTTPQISTLIAFQEKNSRGIKF